MLSRHCTIEDLDLDQWKRLASLAMAHWRCRRLFVAHEGGVVRRCLDTVAGEQPLPFAAVTDAQAQAEELLALRRADGVEMVWVLDLEAFHLALSAAQASLDPKAGITDYLALEWAQRFRPGACAVAPAGEYLHYGLPWGRLERFVSRMLPASCTYVLGVFDGDALWASCLVQFQDHKVVGISTSAALEPEDVRDVTGLDQHPFLLAAVANRYRRPAFGWFCSRTDFEAWMLAHTAQDKEEIFQKALMAKRAVFDFSILLDRGMTVLGPINPGEAALAGADRESNPRTRIPDPGEPGPSAI